MKTPRHFRTAIAFKMKTSITDLNTAETEKWLSQLGFETFRAHQIRQWIFKKLVNSFDDMTNLPKSLRNLLKEKASISHLETVKKQVSKDGTEKFLFELKDGNSIESVLIPERDHSTLCISSQVGCGMNCRFCLTGKLGLKRNLEPNEIIEQVIEAKRSLHNPDKPGYQFALP